jgi:hypothetical protein
MRDDPSQSSIHPRLIRAADLPHEELLASKITLAIVQANLIVQKQE